MEPSEKALKFQAVVAINGYRGVALVIAHVLASGATNAQKVTFTDLFIRAARDLLEGVNPTAVAEFFDLLPNVAAKNLVLAGARTIQDVLIAAATVHLDTVTATVATHQSVKDELVDEA